MQEFAANTVIETNTTCNVLYVRVHLLAKIGNFIDKCYFGRQERIGGVFYQLSSATGGVKDRRPV
jgi:hypothetical protein